MPIDLQGIIAQANAEQNALAPIIEGFRDIADLTLNPDSEAQIKAALTEFDRRRALWSALGAAAEALLKDGAPTPPKRRVSKAVKDEVLDNVATITAAANELIEEAPAPSEAASGRVEITPNP